MFESQTHFFDNVELMFSASLSSYRCPVIHETVSAIIRRHSTNLQDVREVALRGLDLSSVKEVLDLGCGFGFMSDALATRVAPGAHVVGVDAWKCNKALFTTKVAHAGRRAEFVCMSVDTSLPWPDRRFDLIVCCYSLYFFVQVLPEIARVLAPNGRFITITHSEDSVVGQLPAAGFGEAADALLSLTRRFSAENGRELLARWFAEVERIDYINSLRFRPEDADDLFAYLRFKLPLLSPGAKSKDELPKRLTRFAQRALSQIGEVVVQKNDAIFRCGKPLCP